MHHYFEHRGYSWYVDIDALPRLPWWLRPFAEFDPADHLTAPAGPDSLRARVDAYLAGHGIALPGGRVTALLQARVLGYVFNPLTLYWCHDAAGVLRHVIAEVHNTDGGRHAYLLPPAGHGAAMVKKKLDVSPFNGPDGYYLVQAPRPEATLEVQMSLHRDDEPVFVATYRGVRRPARHRDVLGWQLRAPLAPLRGATAMRVHTAALWLRRVPTAAGPGLEVVGGPVTADR